MKALKFLGIASVLLTIGCSHYSDDLSSLGKEMQSSPTETAMAINPQDIAPAAGGAMTGSFSRDLAQEYYAMARYENDKAYDYKASKSFTKKAMTAAKGDLIVPSKISAYDIPADRQGELNDARKQLITALKEQNTAENARTLAKAQARYECWLERAEEAADEAHFEACKTEFEQAMAMLVAPAAGDTPPTIHTIKFANGSSIIDPDSNKVVELVAQFLNDPKNASYTASLTGFSSQPVGGPSADPLVTAQVTAIRDALVQKGIAESRLSPMVAQAGTDTLGTVQVGLLAPPSSVVTPYSSTTTKFVPVTPTPVH